MPASDTKPTWARQLETGAIVVFLVLFVYIAAKIFESRPPEEWQAERDAAAIKANKKSDPRPTATSTAIKA